MLALTWTLESKVNFLFILLHHFLVVCVALTFLSQCPLCRFHQTALHQVIKKNQWKASATAIRNTNDKEHFEIRTELLETLEIHLLHKESKRAKKK